MAKFKRLLTTMLVIVLLLGMISLQVFAAETDDNAASEPVVEEPAVPETTGAAEIPWEPAQVTEETVHIAGEFIVPDVDLPSNEELFAAYAERELYGYDFSFFGTAAGETLTDTEKALYNFLKAKIQRVAAGSLASTEFVLDETF